MPFGSFHARKSHDNPHTTFATSFLDSEWYGVMDYFAGRRIESPPNPATSLSKAQCLTGSQTDKESAPTHSQKHWIEIFTSFRPSGTGTLTSRIPGEELLLSVSTCNVALHQLDTTMPFPRHQTIRSVRAGVYVVHIWFPSTNHSAWNRESAQ